MKTIDLNTLGFMEVYGYAPLNGEQVNRKLSPRMARERATKALKNARRCADGESIWRYDSTNHTVILQNPKRPCFSLALSAEALGLAEDFQTDDRIKFNF